MTTNDAPALIQQALKGVAVYRDTHALKAVFSIERLWRRYPHWPDKLRDRALHLEESVLNVPRVRGLIHEQVAHPEREIPERRWRQNVEIGLYPLAYLSIAEWHRAHGIDKIVASYMDSAVAAINDLGHSWTIWCAFHEALPFLEDETSKLFAAERFAEFVSQQFHRSGRTRSVTTVAACDAIKAPTANASEVFSEALDRPGFLGHHLITLATLIRHRGLLSEKQFSVGLHQTRTMIQFRWNDPALDFSVEHSGHQQAQQLTATDHEALLRKVLAEGSDNVHTLTLVDAAATLWDFADASQRTALFKYLQILQADTSIANSE